VQIPFTGTTIGSLVNALEGITKALGDIETAQQGTLRKLEIQFEQVFSVHLFFSIKRN
jgi:hypothetical protein